MNKLLLVFISSLAVVNCYADLELREKILVCNRSAVFVPKKLGNIGVGHSESGFIVVQDGVSHEVKPWMVSKDLRSRTPYEVRKFMEQNYVSVNKSSDEFSIRAHTRGVGGGPLGAYWGFVGGKAATHAICHGAI